MMEMGSVKAAVIGAVVVVVLLLLVLSVWRGADYASCTSKCQKDCSESEIIRRALLPALLTQQDVQRQVKACEWGVSRCESRCERQAVRAPW